jgi:hypothetical protein
MKGVVWGTPGGALKPLTPPVMALMPLLFSTGIAVLVNPGTSRCSRRLQEHNDGRVQQKVAGA